jgi:hypothetical protein
VSTNDTVPTNKSGPGAPLPLVTPARVIAAICVIVPFISVLWVPIYDKATPEAGGFPFFFWWQLLWVAITAGLMGLAYFVVRREEVAHKDKNAGVTAATKSAADGAADSTEDEGAGE